MTSISSARRVLVGVLAVAVVGAGLLVAPERVWAAENWQREVRFGSARYGTPVKIWNALALNLSSCNGPNRITGSGSYQTYTQEKAADGDEATFWTTSGVPALGKSLKFRGDDAYANAAKTHFRARTMNSATFDLEYLEPESFEVWKRVRSFGGGSATEPYDTGIVEIESVDALIENSIPAAAVCFRLTATGTGAANQGWYVFEMGLYSAEELAEADCNGVAAGADAGLVIPAAGLVHASGHEAWGDVFVPGSGGAEASCAFLTDGQYRYYPPEGITPGETHTVAVEVSSSSSTPCSVLVQWAGSFFPTTILSYTWIGPNPGGATGGGAMSRNTDAPVGATYFNIRLSAQCRLYGLLLGNIEGDPLLDDGSDGTGGPGPDPGGMSWDECVPGTDFLAVGEWVAYAACLIAGLPIAIVTLVQGVLSDLFVPTNVGQRWDAFMAMLAGKAPFGWFSQVFAVVDASTDAGAGSLGSFVFNVGGASVSIGEPIQAALTGVAPYRGLIFAGVAMTMILSTLRWLTAAVGVSPAQPAGGGGS